MTSHAEYIADQDVEQLENLISASQARVETLRLGGWVRLWVVGDYANQAWFAWEDYARAVAFLCKLAQKKVDKGAPTELSIEEGQYRGEEARRLVAQTVKEFPVEDDAMPKATTAA